VTFRTLSLLIFSASLGTAADTVTFDDHVFPIFQQACLNCHNPDKTKGGLDLSTFGATLKGGSSGKVVEPGDTGSTLIHLVLQSAEPKMPPEGEKLSSAQIETLQRWIEGGLLENKSSSARKPSKPKFETALRSGANLKPAGPPPMPQDLLLEPSVITAKAAAVHALVTSPWAPLLAVTGQRQVLLHHTETLELVGVLPFPEGEPVSLAFSPDARYLIVGGGIPGKSGVTVTFDVTTGARLLSAGKEFDTVLAADIRPGFDLVATGGPSKVLKLWNTETGEMIHSIRKHTDWITAIDLSNDGVLLASGDRNGGVWVWESDTANEFHALRAHSSAITGLSFRSDSNLLGTASEDGTVRFWEMNGGKEVKKIDAHPGGVTAFAFGTDGSAITAGRDLKAKLWKPDFRLARDLAPKLPALPTAVALDFENKRAFVADALGTIRVFETADGKPVGEIFANPPSIETRLQSLTDRLNHQDQNIATAEANADRLAKALETTKAAAESLKPIKPNEEAGLQKTQAVAIAEKAAAQAIAQVEFLKAEGPKLRIAVHKWTAASINTEAISTRERAARTFLETEDLLDQFASSTAALAPQTAILNSKRDQQQKLSQTLAREDLSPEVQTEISATLAALETTIERETQALRELEKKALALRESIDRTAPIAHRTFNEAERLKRVYQEARP
jgi:hypothetical protein